MDNQLTFQVEIKDCKATDLTTRHRFKEKLRLRFDFDGRKLKTKKELVGGADVQWKFKESFDYTVTLEHTSQMVLEFVKRELQNRYVRISIGCQHDEKEGKSAQGSAQVDLYTIATGPVEHNIPLADSSGKTIGRLNFSLEMVQLSNIAVMFKEVKLRNLHSVDDSVQSVNPYLKYGYSKHWLAIQDHKLKAVYSETQYSTANPEWSEHQLPPLRFVASLNELVHESIVLHVTHKGKHSNTTIGRANLLFRTLVDNGKSFKEEDVIAFKGPLKVENAEIEGKLIFRFLPHFAQMKAVNAMRKPVHTEKGIFDAMPLLPWLPKPSVAVILSEEKTIVPESPARKMMRARSNSLERTPSQDNISKTFREFGVSSKGTLTNSSKSVQSDNNNNNNNSPNTKDSNGNSSSPNSLKGSGKKEKKSLQTADSRQSLRDSDAHGGNDDDDNDNDNGTEKSEFKVPAKPEKREKESSKKEKSTGESGSGTARRQKASGPGSSIKNLASTDDLISFTPPMGRKLRSATISGTPSSAAQPVSPQQQTFAPGSTAAVAAAVPFTAYPNIANNNNNNNSSNSPGFFVQPAQFNQPFLTSFPPQQFGPVVSAAPVVTSPGGFPPLPGAVVYQQQQQQQQPQQPLPQAATNPFATANPFAPSFDPTATPAQPQQQQQQQQQQHHTSPQQSNPFK